MIKQIFNLTVLTLLAIITISCSTQKSATATNQTRQERVDSATAIKVSGNIKENKITDANNKRVSKRKKNK